jgi:hypothetical protein
MMQLHADTPSRAALRSAMRDQMTEAASAAEAADGGEFLEPAPNGPGCDVTPASAATGATWPRPISARRPRR